MTWSTLHREKGVCLRPFGGRSCASVRVSLWRLLTSKGSRCYWWLVAHWADDERGETQGDDRRVSCNSDAGHGVAGHGVGGDVAAGCSPSDAMDGGSLLQSNLTETWVDLAGWSLRETGTEDVYPHQDWPLSFTLLHVQLGGLLDDQNWNIWTLHQSMSANRMPEYGTSAPLTDRSLSWKTEA